MVLFAETPPPGYMSEENDNDNQNMGEYSFTHYSSLGGIYGNPPFG